MIPALERLLALQALDSKIRAVEDAVTLLPSRERTAAEGVRAAHAELARHQELLRAHEVARRTGEREADALSNEEKRYRAQSAMVKTNEELKALQHEIDAARQKRSEIETAVLERLEQEEGERVRGAELQRAVEGAEAAERNEKEAVAAERERLRAESQALAAQRETIASEVPADLRARYDRLRQGKPGAVVVSLVRGACGGCFTSQPPSRQQQVRAGEQPVACEYCGRLIVGVAGETPASP